MGNACGKPKSTRVEDGATRDARDGATDGRARAYNLDALGARSASNGASSATTRRSRDGDIGGARTITLLPASHAATGDERFGTTDGFHDSIEPWWGVANPTPWTGPPTETTAPTIEEEPFYVSDELKREYRGIAMYPWEGEAWTAPRIREIIEHGLTCADVNEALGRPCTLKMSNDAQIQHLRNAIADVIQTVPFEFAMMLFEGAKTPPEEACRRFLRRLCEATHGGVYCKLPVLHKTKEACLAHVHDSKHLGAALYARIFMLRFVKRFPPQLGFRHPDLDAAATKERLASDRDFVETLDMFKIWPATKAHPAVLIGSLHTAGVKKFLELNTRDAWYGVNQAYEVAVSHPSESLSGATPPMIIDVKKMSVTMFTRANIALMAKQFTVAEFHPEPFAHFFCTNCPYILAALWSVAKLFLTESARKKFVICTHDAAHEIKKRYGVAKKDQPVEFGGDVRDAMMGAREWLAAVPQKGAVKQLSRAMSERRAAVTASAPAGVPLTRQLTKTLSGMHFRPKMAFKTGVRPLSKSAMRTMIRAIEFAFFILLFSIVFRTPVTRLFVALGASRRTSHLFHSL